MLIGGFVADEFHGNDGNDFLIGGAGADKFYFETPLNASTNLDTIGGFVYGTDKIVLDNAIFQALPEGNISVDSLVVTSLAASDFLVV